MTSSTSSFAKICSLDELEIELPDDIRRFLVRQYAPADHSNDYNATTTATTTTTTTTNDDTILSRILAAMKRPPASTICRVNQILATREEVEVALKEDVLKPYPHLQIQKHEIFDDVLCIVPAAVERKPSNTNNDTMNYTSKLPAVIHHPENDDDDDKNDYSYPQFPDWPSRSERGWPMTHRVILCDRYCAEAVLRGADIFVRGILAADSGIQKGDTVAVYADIRAPHLTAVARGLHLERYEEGRCIYLGLGTSACGRSEFFRSSRGVGIVMSKDPAERVGPCLPPLSGMLQDKLMLQNLPSVLVGYALNPQPHDTILDMCAAPGGKSAHLASLVKNHATIVSCDKGRNKILAAKELFAGLGITCITPLVLDATKCVDYNYYSPAVVSDEDDDNKKQRRPTSIKEVRPEK